MFIFQAKPELWEYKEAGRAVGGKDVISFLLPLKVGVGEILHVVQNQFPNFV